MRAATVARRYGTKEEFEQVLNNELEMYLDIVNTKARAVALELYELGMPWHEFTQEARDLMQKGPTSLSDEIVFAVGVGLVDAAIDGDQLRFTMPNNVADVIKGHS